MNITVDRSKLSPKQIAFLDSQQDEVLFGGARGGGKSHVNRIGAVEDCLRYPGRNIIFVRPTIKSAREQFSTAHMAKIIPREIHDEESQQTVEIWRFNAADSVYTFANGSDSNNPFDGGSKLILGGIQTLKDAQESYQGIEFVSIWWDELTKADYEAIEYLRGSLRDTEVKPKFRAASNPGERSHKEVKKRFVDPYYKIKKKNPDKFPEAYSSKIAWKDSIVDPVTGNTIEITYAYIPATLDDNPVKTIRENYLKTLMGLAPHLQKMYREGSWDTYEGKYWDDVKMDDICLDANDLSKLGIDFDWEFKNSKIYMSMDWGYQDYSAVYWHLETSKGVIITFKEYYVNKMLMEDIAKDLEKINKEMKIKPKHIYMPWDLYVRKGAEFKTASGVVIGEELIDLWRYNNSTSDLKASSDRKQGWANMTAALKNTITFRKVLGVGQVEEYTSPAWIILKRNCPHLIEQINATQIDPSNPEDIKGGEDHGVDSCRMFWVAHRIDPKIEEEMKAPTFGTGARLKYEAAKRQQEERTTQRQTSVFDSEW